MEGKDREEGKEGGRRRGKEERGREDGTDGLSVAKGRVAEQETHRMMSCLGDFRAPVQL